MPLFAKDSLETKPQGLGLQAMKTTPMLGMDQCYMYNVISLHLSHLGLKH